MRRVTIHLDDHLWKFNLDRISISTKRSRILISPTFPKIFWRYYNKGWLIASEARFRLMKGNVVEFYVIFKRDEPKPYEPKAFIPVDLNENSVSVLINSKPLLLETNTKRITLGYEYRRKAITTGKSIKDREVRRKLKRLKERDKKVDMRKLAKLIVKEAFEGKSAIVLEDLPRRIPEHMIKDVKDSQLRLRIYRSALSSMKNAIIEKAREFGVPVLLVNPSHTSTVCPVHGTKIVYQPDGGDAPRVGVCGKGKERWHRDVVALYNLKKRAGDVSPVPLGSKESHDPPTLSRWLRAKSLHSIMNEHKMIKMKV